MRSMFVALSAVMLSTPIAHAEMFDGFADLSPVSTMLEGCIPDLDFGGDTCCNGSTCCSCSCPPAPTMIGDSLGVPFAALDGTNAHIITNFYSRVADNNSALPQDRVYFNYKFLNDVRVGQPFAGPGINRDLSYYELGLEKTVADGLISAELILPFANKPGSTIDTPNGVAGASSSQMELLDLAFGLKALLVQTDSSAFSVGVRVEAPTRENIQLPNANGPYMVTQDVWKVTPYLAVLTNLSDDVFFQGFAAYRMPTSDNVELPGVGGFNPWTEPNYLQLDAQLGTWLHRDHDGSGLTGLQAKVELHYTGTFEPYNPANNFAFGVASFGGEQDQLNLTTGLTAIMNDNTTLTGAFVLPLRDASNSILPAGGTFSTTDRMFDWEFVFQINHYFGI